VASLGIQPARVAVACATESLQLRAEFNGNPGGQPQIASWANLLIIIHLLGQALEGAGYTEAHAIRHGSRAQLAGLEAFVLRNACQGDLRALEIVSGGWEPKFQQRGQSQGLPTLFQRPRGLHQRDCSSPAIVKTPGS
jgi:hypothetical protein